MLTAQTLHKGINLVTTIGAASNADANRNGRLTCLKMFGKAHKLTKSDWKQITDAAAARLPVRLTQQPEL